jgi:glycosyltransferase involved in cell wall biosynthesis
VSQISFVFVSNYLNHHQIPFCDEMYGLLGGSFAFIQTEAVEAERVQMGWKAEHEKPYLKLYYEDPKGCAELIDEAAVVLFGGTDEESYIEGRLACGKPVVRYSERLYKTGQWKAVTPRGLRKKYRDHTRYRKQPVYMLCSGAYVPSDFHIVRAYPQKLLKWGYFPETKEYDVDELMGRKGATSDKPQREGATREGAEREGAGSSSAGRTMQLVWAARMIDWKHPELALRTARYLKEKGYDFHLQMIGDGQYMEKVREWIAMYDIADVVTLRGVCTPEQVRACMEEADIYLATSDRQEGWGAVVNEAMNSGCAVVGSHRMGAVPYLIRHGKNGMIYEDGKEETLFEMTEALVADPDFCEALGREAVRTITEDWNAKNAAGRLVAFCKRIGFLPGGEEKSAQGLYETEGLMSLAPVISERGMYRALMRDDARLH